MTHKEKAIDSLLEKLRLILEKKGLSPERAAPFFDVDFRTLYRWLNYESRPTRLSRRAIRLGIRRIQRLK